MKGVAFRADGNKNIGMGHIMRCISLANEFRKSGVKVYFFSKFQAGIQRIQEEKFEVIELTNNREEQSEGVNYGEVSELKQEVTEMLEFNLPTEIDILFIDSYNVSAEYFDALKQTFKKLAYVDDVNKFIYPVDLLLNCNIIGEYMIYEKYSEGEVILLGTKYNLLREEFKGQPKKEIKKQVEKIMVTAGGSDPYDLSSKMVNMLLKDGELGKLQIHVVIAPAFKNVQQLEEIARKNANVLLHENVKSMSELMKNSDIAIAAGGSTLNELCACGTPALGYTVSYVHEDTVNKLAEQGYIGNLGWYNKFNQQDFCNNIKGLCNNYQARKEMSGKMQKLIDGLGAKRVTEVVLNSLLNE